jgi:16S rRNA processing protein RimM
MNSSAHNRFAEIGRIGKAHGLQGEFRFLPGDHFTADLFERISIFYMKNRRSDMVPLRLMEYRLESRNKQPLFFVKFDAIANRSDANEAMDRSLFADRSDLKSILTEYESGDTDLSGYAVFCDDTKRGTVLDVLDNPAHPILQIKDQSGQLLIPFVEEYVQRVDHEKAVIYCKNLDQLI